MKKILALILLVSCIFTLCSCKFFKKDNGDDADNGDNTPTDVVPDNTPSFDLEAIAAIQAKIDASAPETADITVTLEAALGALNSEYNVTYNSDGTASVVYTYEKFNSFDEDSDEYKSAYSGTVTVGADGTLSEEVGGAASVEALTFDITLDASKFSTVTVVSGVFTADIKAENTQAVLGVNLGADASLVVSTNASGVVSVAISYTSVAGSVEIIATYTYPAAPAE